MGWAAMGCDFACASMQINHMLDLEPVLELA